MKNIIFLSNILIYLIKRRKVRVYNASIIIFNESIMGFTVVNLSLDLSPDDLTLIGKFNG